MHSDPPPPPVAASILEHCRAAKSNRNEILALGDLVARTTVTIKGLHHMSPVHGEAVRKAMHEINEFLMRNDTTRIDAEHRVNRFANKIKAVIGAKDTQVELSLLQTRLVQAASVLQLDLQVRTVTGVDQILHDTEQLLANNEAFTQKLDELTLKLDQLSDVTVFFARELERLNQAKGLSEERAGHRDRLAEMLRKQQSHVLEASRRINSLESSLPFDESVENWMISSLEVQFDPRPENIIGKGSTSVVYRGYYHSMTVAVKVFNDLFNDEPKLLEDAIRKEISAWMQLSGKPYILRLEGVCTKVAQPFIVSEFCKSTADKHIRRNPQNLLRIIFETACGLETIHAAGVIHRDIKAANILITETNHAAIADFGLSKNLLSIPSFSPINHHRSFGTLNWMSPEQRLHPSQITAKADIWSFGMLMWELVTGKIPFHDCSDHEILEAIQSITNRPAKPQGCDERLWSLMLKCWSVNPEARPLASEIVSFLATSFQDSLGSTVALNVDWTIFVSYSWKNSKEAFRKGEISSLGACGPCDPRELGRQLTSLGHASWLDVDRIKVGEPLFDHLVDGMRPAKLAVICVSNEYAASENCIREFKFLRELKIPCVLVLVGQDSENEWRRTVVGFISQDSLYIDTRGSPTNTLGNDVLSTIVDAIEEQLNVTEEPMTTLQRHTLRHMPSHLPRSSTTRSQTEETEQFIESAKSGNIKAKVTLARMYLNGDGVEKDIGKSIDWFKNAAMEGDVSAQFEVARIYESGLGGVEVNFKEALNWFEDVVYKEAAAKNDARAQFMVGQYHHRGLGMEKVDMAKAIEWYKKASSHGSADADAQLGLLYLRGQTVAKDVQKAFTFFAKAAEHGNVIAQVQLANIFKTGAAGVVSADEARAADWYRKGAMVGDAESQDLLGLMYLNGSDATPKNYGIAVEWFQQAAEQGYNKARNNLAYMLANGFGISKDPKEAFHLYSLTASEGSAEGQTRLGVMHLTGQGAPQDFGIAVTLFTKAASQGNAEAEYQLGFAYRNGSGVSRDLYKAYEWYLKSAEKGNSDAQNSMGSKYLTGAAGVNVSYSKAYEWFLKSAQQGNPKGQFNLGFMYEHGRHVHRDKKQAAVWYRKAAAQGFAEAEKALLNLPH
ncbi:hypothetical protein HDU98_008947 [Podochytrium sp. JEL0797]|nr:hypothetical protein HDU98_008947 [Podochytrium sp. JEL0797]